MTADLVNQSYNLNFLWIKNNNARFSFHKGMLHFTGISDSRRVREQHRRDLLPVYRVLRS